jgi:hypothetical protein
MGEKIKFVSRNIKMYELKQLARLMLVGKQFKAQHFYQHRVLVLSL